MQLIHGDCLDALRNLPDCTVDSVVTDPPAGIAFMGKHWDGDKGGRDLWIAWLAERLAECLRVLKPGGHAVVWALPRTSGWTHRALEDAGFDVRDCVHHLFGSGFPKSLDVGKAIDRRRDDEAAKRRVAEFLELKRQAAGFSCRDINQALGLVGDMAGAHWANPRSSQIQTPPWDWWLRLRDLLGFDDEMDAEVWRLNGRKGTPGEAWEQREVIGQQRSTRLEVAPGEGRARPCVSLPVTAPATPAAQQWDGFGTALKPAVEHWWLARKPLDSTVAGTVTRWGTGALNVSACRVDSGPPRTTHADGNRHTTTAVGWRHAVHDSTPSPTGRWPADCVLSHNPTCDGVCSPGCAVAELDQQSGVTSSTERSLRRVRSLDDTERGWRIRHEEASGTAYGDSGGASRYFTTFRYQAKPSTREKNNGLDDRNHHPTIKPAELMRWLCRLVTPPGGTVLDPFAGSGTTGVAAVLEGFDVVLVEAEAEYLPLIEGRVRWAEAQVEQPALSFG